MSTTYRGHVITRTSATTGDGAHVYEIDGTFSKNACTRPFLTSIRDCKKYIAEQIERENYRRAGHFYTAE